jgi:hypothetical protein
MNKSDSITKLAAALAKFQIDVENPKNIACNPQYNSKYAPLDEVISTVRPILGKYGLSFTQSTGTIENRIALKTMLIHESGEWLESEALILSAYQYNEYGQKELSAQGAGSAITYARRYSLSAMLGIASENDNDGIEATSNFNTHIEHKKYPITAKQQRLIKARIEELIALGGEKETVLASLRKKVGEFNELSEMDTDQASVTIDTLTGWVIRKQQQREPAKV